MIERRVDKCPPEDGNVKNLGNQAAPLERILKYQREASKIGNPLVASLATINSRLMQLNLALSETLNEMLIEVPPTPEGLARVAPGIDLLLRVSRQVDRLAQLELKAGTAGEVHKVRS